MSEVSVYWNIVLLILRLHLHTFADCKIFTIGRYLNYDWYNTRWGKGIYLFIESFFDLNWFDSIDPDVTQGVHANHYTTDAGFNAMKNTWPQFDK